MTSPIAALREPTFGYRLVRFLARLRWWSRRVRLLEAERLRGSPASILAVNGAAGWANALLLTAALDPPLVWIGNFGSREGVIRRWGVRLLGALPASGFGPPALEAVADALRSGKTLATFFDSPAGAEGGVSSLARLLAALAEKWPGPAQLAVFPVDVFAPPKPFRKWETLIALGGPIYPREHLHRAEGSPEKALPALLASLEEARRLNAFRLFPPQIESLRGDLEDLLRAELRDEWAARPDGRQQPEDFALSRFLSRWIETANSSDPARLAALADSVARYRRARRNWSEHRFAVETAGDWIASPLAQAAAWAESWLGLPIALYGLVNHLPAGLAVWALERRRKPQSRKSKWALRGAVLLAAYAAETLLLDRWLGRAVAGYYALTLPVSGAYLWRYARLWRDRTRPLLSKLRIPYGARRLRSLRRDIALRLDREVASGAEREPSPGGGILSGGAPVR